MPYWGHRAGERLTGRNLTNLHTFLVVARHMSFARAADELCLTASAVSHRIARLEGSLHVKLFWRLPREISLTDDGERIFLIMQDAMDSLSEVFQQQADAPVAGPLTLYVRPSIARCWLVPQLGRFAAQYPQVQLDIRVGNERIDYRTRKIDLALCYASDGFPGLVSTLLMSERIAPVCSPEYARRLALLHTPSRLHACTLLHDVEAWENAAFDAEWRLWAKAAGALDYLPEHSITFDRSDLCVTSALGHGGIAIGRERLVRSHIKRGELVLPFGDFVDCGNHGYYLVHPAHSNMPKRLQVLIDWLRALAGEATQP
ncbi:DNA-binding transcriptional regulator DsdC [Pseudomonas sp. 21LCFQ010]|uniref:DNA-binding transcriptional regulator DsdC n=1 Tax=Pseudomonas sp. 21LCFQ010 TaxID=2957506 RepID=UPI0020977497|nr:DNA-binding transcriptional regulator DsdC [Pseudomonas sp. 21LCFQ010]MCO8160557.1 DNA-binding transcriptional regulator DsdC [Pseudomonas sp. 21LCFQ010]